MKPNSTPTYVHRDSNHPKTIIENIPKSVNKRLSAISASKEVFDAASPPYQAALERSGYDFKLNPPKAKTGQEELHGFNPPFSKNVQTNIGGKSLSLIRKHFPKNNPLSKIINQNTVKISYRCMGNFKQKITAHNSRVKQQQGVQPPPPSCNCTGEMGPCLLGGYFQIKSVVYGAEVVDSNNNVETYTGLTSNTFKQRLYGYRHSFKHEDSDKSTTLSTYIWDLKKRNQNFDIHWSVKERVSSFNPVRSRCNLCIREKYFIIFQPEGASLNSRSELFTTCRHRKKQLLANT